MMIKFLPVPKSCQIYGEDRLSCKSAVYTACSAFAPYQATLADYFARISCPLATDATGGITLCYDAALAPDAYVIDTKETPVVYASAPEGLCYALASLLQMVKKGEGEITLPRVRIEDRPDKPYRSLMCDLARCWHPFWQLLQFVDVCFLYKINYLHLHFADDQRYTLPSRLYPNVTSNNRHYTFEDIEAFRAYANARGIILVPEFEVPGHAAMLVKTYPEIFALRNDGKDDASLITEEGLVITADNIICAGSEACEKAIRDMIGEICQMFPETPYIHIGGDEANIKAWNNCSECVRYMQEHNCNWIFFNIESVYSDWRCLDVELQKSFALSLCEILEQYLYDYYEGCYDDEFDESGVELKEEQVRNLIQFLKENKETIDSEIEGSIELRAGLGEDGFAYVQRFVLHLHYGNEGLKRYLSLIFLLIHLRKQAFY